VASQVVRETLFSPASPSVNIGGIVRETLRSGMPVIPLVASQVVRETLYSPASPWMNVGNVVRETLFSPGTPRMNVGGIVRETLRSGTPMIERWLLSSGLI